MNKFRYPSQKDWPEILRRPVADLAEIERKVLPILQDVKANGDAALRKFSRLFDKVELENFAVSERELADAEKLVTKDLQDAIALAKANIEKFHLTQKESPLKIETTPGVVCWRKSISIQSIGLYIPGGSAPLFSTVLMLGVPARIAGCQHIILCTPPERSGTVHPAVLYTANLLGIKKIFKIGGAQAIAAMAYGTESVPKVDKIFGPGNRYVTAAKQLVNTEGIAIDLPAGPTELAVIADNSSHPAFVAADLLSQAEHGPDSQVVLISDDEKTIETTVAEIARQIEALPRKEIAAQALTNSKSILVKNLETAIALVNAYAPEHLILAVENAEMLSEKVVNAGSVFLGHFAPEAVGDYAAGTNHTLPTNGFARTYSGVSVDSFVKKITFQHLTESGLQNIGKAVETMAEAEGLHGHKNAVTIRVERWSSGVLD